MKKYIIVGGGLPGVLLANVLVKRGISFQGLESSKQVGGEFHFSEFRVHQDSSVGFLKDLLGYVEWNKVDEQPQERIKGAWKSKDDAFIDEERPFVGNPFYHPHGDFDRLVKLIKDPVQQSFLTEKNIERIDLDKKTVLCKDGTEFYFECIAWCSGLRALLSAVNLSSKVNLKKARKNDDFPGGIHLEMKLSKSLTPFLNSMILPFRYKDHKLRALGLRDLSTLSEENTHRIQWLVFLERELSDDREEVAKVIRALKRELQKEFPEIKNSLLKEKIIFQPKMDSFTPFEVKGLELFPGVFYVGPEVHLADAMANGSPLDVTIDNCKWFQMGLTPATTTIESA